MQRFSGCEILCTILHAEIPNTGLLHLLAREESETIHAGKDVSEIAQNLDNKNLPIVQAHVDDGFSECDRFLHNRRPVVPG